MKFDVLTLFPELIESHMNFSIMKLAVDDGIIEVNKQLDDNVKIGHSYFCKPMSDEDVAMTVKYSIIPYIKQYYKDDIVKENELVNILESTIQ